MKTFESFFRMLFQLLVDVVTAEENLVKWSKSLKFLIENGILDNSVIIKIKLALKQTITDGAINAPKAGVLDEEIKTAIKESPMEEMENIPLPNTFNPS